MRGGGVNAVSAKAQPMSPGFSTRPLEGYAPQVLLDELLARRPVRTSVPESVTRFVGLRHLDWSREVEVPPLGPAPELPEHALLLARMATLEGRYLAMQALVYAMGGRIWYTMLGGARYAARVDWGAASGPARNSAANTP
jgi:hypothetical protein